MGKNFKLERFYFIIMVFFLTLSLIVAVCWQSIFDLIMKTHLQLDFSSTLFKMWIKSPLPIFLEVYLFNITNAEEWMRDKSVTLNFEEIGPFLFDETREKVGVFWSDSQDTITFNQSKTWRLLPDQSENFLAEIINLNPIAMTIAHISRLWNSNLQRQIANSLINLHEPLLVKASARQWLFDGIPDEFLNIFGALRKVADIPIPYNKFGWFFGRNGSSSFDGIFTIKTGKSSISDLGMMVSWNNVNKTEHYKDDCSLVCGTTGEILPPVKRFQKNLIVFSSDICSYIALKYSGPTSVGVLSGIEYVGDESVFDNGTLYPENLCFYQDESCLSGSRNVSTCSHGSPAFISFPHFYLADPDYRKKISGMAPNEKKHKFTLKVEPVMGVPLEVEGSFQINFLLRPYEWCDEFREVTEIYVPMLWFKQKAKISKAYEYMMGIFVFMYNVGNFLLYIVSFLILIKLLKEFYNS